MAPDQANDLKIFAHSRFPDLSEGEDLLLLEVCSGEVVIFTPDSKFSNPANHPSHADQWGQDRSVRADLIRWLCTNREAKSKLDARGIQLHGTKITGKLDLSFVHLDFPLSFVNCHFDDDIHLTHAQVPALNFAGSYMHSLLADRLNVEGSIFLRTGLLAKGRIELRDAQIGGTLLCDGGIFDNPSGIAIAADRIKVTGSILLRNGFIANGEVRFPGAQVGSNIECDYGKFDNLQENSSKVRDPVALMLDRARVGGNVSLQNRFQARGAVRLHGAQLSGHLDCTGGTFENPGGRALTAENIKVDGNLFLRDQFSAVGTVIFMQAQIIGGVDCRSGTFEELNFTMAKMGVFRWINVLNVSHIHLNLNNASTVNMIDQESSWPEKGNLNLDGFSYVRISEGPTDSDSRLKWLDRADQFTRQPYWQLAKFLRETGDDRGARYVLIEMEDRRRQAQNRHLYVRCLDWILKWTIGYGHKSWRALKWLAGFTLLSCMFSGFGYLGGAIAPNDKEAYITFEKSGYPPPYYPQFNPLVFSFEHSFPLINLGMKDHWTPNLGDMKNLPIIHSSIVRWIRSRELCGVYFFQWKASGFLRVCFWLQVPLSWALATLFVAGLTGIVKGGP